MTWERFALGRIPRGNSLTGERTVNAQVELRPNGDFVTRSNAVKCAYRRINPFDWDGDGWHNADDPDPRAWTDAQNFSHGRKMRMQFPTSRFVRSMGES